MSDKLSEQNARAAGDATEVVSDAAEPSRDGEKKEAVKDTLKEIKSAKPAAGRKKRSAADIILLIVEVLFFPITLAVIGFRRLFKRFKVGITVKTTVVFTAIFGLVLIGYAAFTLASIFNIYRAGGVITPEYMYRLIVTSAVLVAVFIVIGAVLGGFTSQYELKTPLSVIAGYANLLRRWGKDDPKILDEAVEAISRESENMKRIVDQLLWLAKLGNFTLSNSIFNLYETVGDIVDGYKTVKIKHDISLSGDPSITLNTDKNVLTEAVRTLVDNAIKYTPPTTGVIKIAVSRKNDCVEISVADNGIGISEADRAHVFERFYRCDKVRGRESGSSGLGLTICKSIVEMIGGRISVESELGKGSTFTITLY